MSQLTLTTAGESHGPQLTAIIAGMPSGLCVSREWIDAQLARRQAGYGRSPRQQIEHDRVEVTAGLRHGTTLGSPIALHIANRDHGNWSAAMSPWPTDEIERSWRDRAIHVVRPGHADFGGIARGDFVEDGLRPVLERASARETAVRVAAGSIAQQLLASLGVVVRAHVTSVGGVGAVGGSVAEPVHEADPRWSQLDERRLRVLDPAMDFACAARVDEARESRDTLGGTIEICAWGLPPGVGTYASAEGRLDARLARAAMSVHAMKFVAIGDALDTAHQFGSAAHDPLRPATSDAESHGLGATRDSNRAGGIEGGMTNGAPISIRVGMKPLPTLMNPLASVDLATGEATSAHAERSDTCAIAAAAIVLETAIAFELAAVILEQFGGASIGDLTTSLEHYRSRVHAPARGVVELSPC
jgi:chorismate synthase